MFQIHTASSVSVTVRYLFLFYYTRNYIKRRHLQYRHSPQEVSKDITHKM